MNKDDMIEDDMIEDVNDDTIEEISIDMNDDVDEDIVEQEEQPNEDVPYHYANNQNQYVNSDKKTVERLQAASVKNKTLPTHLSAFSDNHSPSNDVPDTTANDNSKELEQKNTIGQGVTSGLENSVKSVAKEAATTAGKEAVKKAATGFLLKYKFVIIGVIAVVIIFLVIIFIFLGGDDQSDVSSATNSYFTGGMTDEELIEYLKYMGICSEAGVDYEDLTAEEEATQNTADCKYALQFYKKIKEEYEEKQEACSSNITTKKDIDKPCEVSINFTLLFETLSYGKSDHEIWNKRATPNQLKDIEDLANAMVEYVHESCYVLVKQYKTPDGKIQTEDCENCTKLADKKDPRDWYYFQVSFDKYISFLKYGDTSTHPYYTGKEAVKFGENHDHVCLGQTNTMFSSSNNEQNNTNNNYTVEGTGAGTEIAKYALQFVGNPYVWGGTSLTNGADCSGFTMSVFAKFGISLPHSSVAQSKMGTNISGLNNALPGDLIFYGNGNSVNHVGIYMGNNQVVHASSAKTGIKTSVASYRTPIAIKRFIG